MKTLQCYESEQDAAHKYKGYRKSVYVSGSMVVVRIFNPNEEEIISEFFFEGFCSFVFRCGQAKDLERRYKKAHKWAEDIINVIVLHEVK